MMTTKCAIGVTSAVWLFLFPVMAAGQISQQETGSPTIRVDEPVDAEAEWNAIKDSKNKTDFETFRHKFWKSRYAAEPACWIQRLITSTVVQLLLKLPSKRFSCVCLN
jgi:hypothetical protein